MPEIRMNVIISDKLNEKLKGADLGTELGRCAEMAFVFLKMFDEISDAFPEAIQHATDRLNRIEDGRLRSFLSSFGD